MQKPYAGAVCMCSGKTMAGLRIFGLMAAGAFALLAVPAFAASDHTTGGGAQALPKPQHVFIIVLENKGYDQTFGPQSPATYLRGLAAKGALLQNYFGVGHDSLDNYIAMVSGQAPNPTTQADCNDKYLDFHQTGTGEYDQALGDGCIYPQGVHAIVDQLKGGLSWKAYMEDMGNNPGREHPTCGQPIGYPKFSGDSTQIAEKNDQYAARHNPFVYFHSIIDDMPGCDAHVVSLKSLATDLMEETTTPNYVFITPNLCHDGHDGDKPGTLCVDGHQGGLIAADQFLRDIVPKILDSPAFAHDGLLIVTFDEADIDIEYNLLTGKETHTGSTASCCDEQPAPNIKPGASVFGAPDKGPGIAGPGGGRIGAVLVSRFIEPGTVSKIAYNHYSMLRSIEDFFEVGHLGYAGQKGLRPFGRDVFTKPNSTLPDSTKPNSTKPNG